MVLTNTGIVGFGLLILVCTPSIISEQRNQSRLPETTTTSAKSIAVGTKNVTSAIQILPTIASKPKTDVINDKLVEQKNNRGSVKYADRAFSTTEKTRETHTTYKQNVQENKGVKITTARNDRSLSINTIKYNSPETHIENNVYSETQIADKRYGNIINDKYTTAKSWAYGNFADHILTTPRNDVFDSKYRKIQEDITRSFNDILTTPKNDIFDNKYKEMEENIAKSVNIELTTPKDETFDNSYRKLHEDISKSLDSSVDHFFNENKSQNNAESLGKPHMNDSKLDYTRYRNIEAVESKIKNKVHKNYNTETGIRMKLTSEYNNTQVIDAPGIVINTIPTKDEYEIGKKLDLDQGETIVERITIEKPEKDPSPFISNKIENELVNSPHSESPVEKPYEHKNIYLSKRGSTVQNRDQTIEKTLSTESGVPLDLYPVKSSASDLINSSLTHRNAENDASTYKTPKNEKLSLKSAKKESDLDNKIPTFLPVDIPVGSATSVPLLHPSSESTEEISTQAFYEVDRYTTPATVPTLIESYSGEVTGTTEVHTETTESTIDGKFFEVTEDATVKTVYADDITTVDVEVTTEVTLNYEETTVTKQAEEDTTTQRNDNFDVTEDFGSSIPWNESANTKSRTSKSTVVRQSWNSEDPNSNQSSTVTESITENKETTEMVETTSFSVSSVKPLTAVQVSNSIATNNPNDIGESGDKNIATTKKNEDASSIINEVTKPPNLTMNSVTISSIPNTTSSQTQSDAPTERVEKFDASENITIPLSENDQTKQNEININGDKLPSDDCENVEENDDYPENNCKAHTIDEGNDTDVELDDNGKHNQNGYTEENKQSTAPPATPAHVTSRVEDPPTTSSTITISAEATATNTKDRSTTETLRKIETPDENMETTARTDSIVAVEDDNDEDGGNGGKIAAIIISTIGGICLLLLVALLIIMKKRQKRFNYGQRCRPVSLDAYSMDNVSIHNSARRKGVLMASKRSYGNPAFEDPACPTHLLTISELFKFSNNEEAIRIEFDKIPQVTTKTNELPEGCDVKNRYANVIPLPETRVFLSLIEGNAGSDYINANYVTGPQGSRHYYIACQAPLQNTIEDFWRMVWEQQSKVILMLTHLYEGGVEKCIDYLPPSEVLDCHRLFGDYQVTLKKREVKDKYIISSLQLKNMVSNSWREVVHLWYMGWPEKGIPDEANSLIAFLLEARSCMKAGDTKVKETNNINISNGLTPNLSPVIVHCSPGTGRTGTVIACDIAVREFELTRKVDIPLIVYKIRRDRASAVQTKEQYAFIYKVISFYATKLTGTAFDSF